MTAAWKKSICLALLSLMPISGSAEEVTMNLTLQGGLDNRSLGLTLSLVGFLSPPCPSEGGQACGGVTPYYLYVAAILPSGTTSSVPSIYLLNDRQQWILYLGGPLPAYLRFINALSQKYLPILDQVDLTGLIGTQILVGYGLDDQEMLSARRYAEIYRVQ
jgi:hypothetical protein